MVESQSSIEMKVGKGSGEDLEEEEEKDLGPSSNLINAKISRSLKRTGFQYTKCETDPSSSH